jgi:signal peptidase II
VRRWGIVLGVAAAVVALDQLTKWWALHALRTHTIHVIWTLQFNLTRNTGAAFSLSVGRGPIIGVLALVIVGVLLWQGSSVSTRWGAVAIGLVLGGALGNLIDRAVRGDAGFLHGAVVDFIDFQWWPVFNVADMGVVIGALLLVVVTVLQPGERP